MLKGANKDLAFLTDFLGERGERERDLTDAERRRATELGLRKYRGELRSTSNYNT